MSGRNPITRDGIDQVNQAVADVDNAHPFAEVQKVLDGIATAREQRGTSPLDICDAILPANQFADNSKPSLLVSISPNSFDEGASGISNPLIAAVQTGYQLALQANPKRQRLFVQNGGGTGLYIIFGSAATFGAVDSTLYHAKIAVGETFIDEMWVGRIDIVSDAPGGKVSIWEMWRTLNVSQ
jgi:hypothetical protein